MSLTRSRQFTLIAEQNAGFALSTLDDLIGLDFDDLVKCPPILFSLINPTTLRRMDQTRIDELPLICWTYLKQECLGIMSTECLQKILERSLSETSPNELLFWDDEGKLVSKETEPLHQRIEKALKTAKRNEKETRIKNEFRCRDLTETIKSNVISLTHLAARLDLDASTIRKCDHLRLKPISGSRNGRKQCYFVFSDVLAYINSIYVPADENDQLGNGFPLLYRLCSLAIRHRSKIPSWKIRREIQRSQSYFRFSSNLILVTEEAFLNALEILKRKNA